MAELLANINQIRKMRFLTGKFVREGDYVGIGQISEIHANIAKELNLGEPIPNELKGRLVDDAGLNCTGIIGSTYFRVIQQIGIL